MNDTVSYSVAIKSDGEGLTGRECPQCEKYFKIKFGTGLPGAPDCHCPYCNHVGNPNTFWTKAQIEYAQSVALNELSNQLIDQLKKMERKPDRKAFLSIGISVKGQPMPITYYSEHDLEQHVTCTVCTLEYAIYGAFGYCPDCGIHNSQQIALVNFDLALKFVSLAETVEEDIKFKLIENALEDTVSVFDGFAREHCTGLTYKISFQNINAARDKLKKEEECDIASGLSEQQWNFICEQFQKRHLLAHKMGIVDEEFVTRTGSQKSLIGRKVSITANDVRTLVKNLKSVVNNLYNGIIHH